MRGRQASPMQACSPVGAPWPDQLPFGSFFLPTTKGSFSHRSIIFASSSLATASNKWVASWANVILGHCNHLAVHQHIGQWLTREQLLLVPGLGRQGAECSQASALHTKIISGSQPCLGNKTRIGAETA